MNFDSYTDRVVGVAAALVNALTPGEHGGRPVEPDPARAAAVLGRPVGPAEAAELTRLAGRLRPVFLAAEDGATDRVAELVNALLADYRSEPRLSRLDGEPWHLHFTSSAAGTEWGAACATGLAVVVDGQAAGRLGVCRADCCDRVYVDVSRNASRRFCPEACLNRTKVAAFRARARATLLTGRGSLPPGDAAPPRVTPHAHESRLMPAGDGGRAVTRRRSPPVGSPQTPTGGPRGGEPAGRPALADSGGDAVDGAPAALFPVELAFQVSLSAPTAATGRPAPPPSAPAPGGRVAPGRPPQPSPPGGVRDQS